MNIACDARALLGPLTGVGTWTAQLSAGLAGLGNHRVLLAAPRAITLPEELQVDGVTALPPTHLRLPGTLWLHSVLPLSLAACGAELFVASLAVVPRRCPVPSVLMLHDITPRTHPHRHTLVNRFCFNAYLEESLERARAVVVGSHATEEAALDVFPWLRGRLVRIGYGVDTYFSPADDAAAREEVRRRFAGGSPYLLHLGTIEPRKGLLHLIEAWELLQQRLPRPPALVLAGAAGWGTAPIFARIARSSHRQRIHLPGYVSRSDARELLRHTDCFVLASEVEGYGLPLAEAVSCGAPAVATPIPALREGAGNACLLAPPGDSQGLADAIARALEPATAARLRAAAAVCASELRWGPVVAAWSELLEAVLRER